MKTIYFLRTLVAMILMCCVVAVNAATYQVTDQASFEEALSKARFCDAIQVSGEITLNKTIVVDKNVRIIGTTNAQGVPTATIKGNGSEKLFTINPPEGMGEAILFADLVLKDGSSTGEGDDFDGGAAKILSGLTYFVNCCIEDNYSIEDGGAIAIVGDDTWVLFDNCTISNNNAIKRGGAFYIGGNSTVRFDYCLINANKTGSGNFASAPVGDHGGAFFIDDSATVDFFYCGINNNASSWVRPEYMHLFDADAPERDRLDSGSGGGAFCLNGKVAVTLEASSIRGNTSIRDSGHGSAVFGMGAYNFTMINSIAAQNLNRGAGSFFMASAGGSFTMINSAWIRNHGYENASSSSGLHLLSDSVYINIFNSLVVGNTVSYPASAVDISANNTENVENRYLIKNSAIGAIHGGYMENATARFLSRTFDSPNIPTKSKINYYNPEEQASVEDWMDRDMGKVPDITGSGYDWAEEMQTTTRGVERAWQPIVAGTDSWIYKGADPALLDDAIMKLTDFMNAERTPNADGSTFAGPLMRQHTDQLRDVLVLLDRIYWIWHCGSIDVPVSQDIDVRVINGVIYIALGNLRGQLKGELISLNGQIVQTFDRPATVYYVEGIHTNVEKGVYILKVTIGGQMFAKPIVVN